MVAAVTYSIYALYDPRTNEPRYVGMSRNVDARFKSHLSKSHGEVRKWIDSLKEIGLKPYLVILGEADSVWPAIDLERHFIRELGRDHKLLNWLGSFQFERNYSKSICAMRKRKHGLLVERQMKMAIKGVDCGLQRKINGDNRWGTKPIPRYRTISKAS